MGTFLVIFLAISILPFIFSLIADLTDSRFGIKSWYRKQENQRPFIATIAKWSPHQFWRVVAKLFARYPRTGATLAALVVIHIWLHLANPYATINFFESPYKTYVTNSSQIDYTQVYRPIVLADPVSDFIGYYRSGFLIAQNTLAGGAPIEKSTVKEILTEIHTRRFDPNKPYLISGDQFSVLYPRNLGVFYNQLLDPNTAQSISDWENRQRIYLQSVLFAIDGLSVGNVPKTTIVPIAPRTVVTTRVHPGDVGSDSVYGTLFALQKLLTNQQSADGKYKTMTTNAAKRILKERRSQLSHMVKSYLKTVRDPGTGLINTDIHLSSARDGASRKSSFYDNIILWKTIKLADELGVLSTSQNEQLSLQKKIKETYWNEKQGYYNNDRYDTSFSSDWLIGYVTDFFDLTNDTDLQRTRRTIDFIENSNLAKPLPIKYQEGKPKDAPWVIKTFVPNYGGDAIWSYWGAEYMTLLVNIGDAPYLKAADVYRKRYDQAILRDGGFAETFNSDGQFLQSGIYKSIRVTGWVVQYEHAVNRLDKALSQTSLGSPEP